jgi:hypothetical protein
LYSWEISEDSADHEAEMKSKKQAIRLLDLNLNQIEEEELGEDELYIKLEFNKLYEKVK